MQRVCRPFIEMQIVPLAPRLEMAIGALFIGPPAKADPAIKLLRLAHNGKTISNVAFPGLVFRDSMKDLFFHPRLALLLSGDLVPLGNISL